jgi:hypothetical protein
MVEVGSSRVMVSSWVRVECIVSPGGNGARFLL